MSVLSDHLGLVFNISHDCDFFVRNFFNLFDVGYECLFLTLTLESPNTNCVRAE